MRKEGERKLLIHTRLQHEKERERERKTHTHTHPFVLSLRPYSIHCILYTLTTAGVLFVFVVWMLFKRSLYKSIFDSCRCMVHVIKSPLFILLFWFHSSVRFFSFSIFLVSLFDYTYIHTHKNGQHHGNYAVLCKRREHIGGR
jgi:hypothetical protein